MLDTLLSSLRAPGAGAWAVLALGSVLVFWMVGAYNRLVALRTAVGSDWAQVQAALARRAEAVLPLVGALRGPLVAEQGTLDQWQALHTEATRAATALAVQPLAAPAAQAFAAAESALASVSTRVLALLEAHPELRHEPVVAAALQAWHEGQGRIGFARQLFNTSAASYDRARAQAPTRWLARVYGFKPAGRV